MLEFERGEIDVEKVQSISKQGVLIKYKAELATQGYNKNVSKMNEFLLGWRSNYTGEVSKLQSLEEARIGFEKFVMDKFIQNLNSIGQTINFVADQCLNDNDKVTTQDTLLDFIYSSRSKNPLPLQIEPEVYKPKAELVKYRNELAARHQLQSANLQDSDGDELELEGRAKSVKTPEEKVRRLLF